MRPPLATTKLHFLPAIFLLAAAVCIFDRATATLDREGFLVAGYETMTFGLFAARGTGMALSVFAAGWVIWGAGRLVARVAVSLTVLVTVLTLWQRLYVPELPWNVVSQHASSVLTWLGALVLFAWGRNLGLRMVSDSMPAGRDLSRWQVSILDLLVMTTAAAILLAVTRGYLPRDFSQWQLSEDEVLLIGMHSAANLLIVATVLTCCHRPHAWWQNVLLAGGLSAAIAGIHLAALSRCQDLPMHPIDVALAARGIHHAVLFAWLLGGLAALHVAGFRLRRMIEPVGCLRPLAVAS